MYHPSASSRRHGSFHNLVLLGLLLAVALGGLGAHLLVVLLERRQVLARLGELALLRAGAYTRSR